MNCFNHPVVPAVAHCSDCGKGLCSVCAKQYTILICSPCNAKRISNEKGLIRKELYLTYGMGILLTLLQCQISIGSHNSDIFFRVFMILVYFYICSGIIAGWYTLARITPQIFLILPLFGWLIYFVVKVVISIYVGLIMLPIRTYQNIKRLKELEITTIY
jgi:hypothetical protein